MNIIVHNNHKDNEDDGKKDNTREREGGRNYSICSSRYEERPQRQPVETVRGHRGTCS